jgi:hypothetical protein
VPGARRILQPPPATAAAAAPSPVLPVSTAAQESDLATHPSPAYTTVDVPDTNSPEVHGAAHRPEPEDDRVTQVLLDGFLGAAEAVAAAVGSDRHQSEGEAAVQPPGSVASGPIDREKPPVGALRPPRARLFMCPLLNPNILPALVV